jgi:acyl-CoA thioester hydrolase
MLNHITEEKIRVRYAETDMMGHAYYGNYMPWFEQSRGAWCRDRGFTYKSIEELGYMLPAVELHVRYKHEIEYDDLLIVRVHLAEIKRAAVKFVYEIFNTRIGKVATEGYTWHVLMGPERKAVTIPENIKDLLLRDPTQYKTIS